MSLSAGTRLGPYEILSALGAGGMGEVYRAHDTKLNRDVAIKVLPDLFANDPERLARFQREAQVLASLNHPNIAHIHGLEESNPSAGSGQAAVRALVMELVEGETLEEKLRTSDVSRLKSAGSGLPLDEALAIAKQIADALEAAHEQGFIHRDLKPANIKVRLDGTVKVLDFGLAKAIEGPGGSGGPGRLASQSPTITTPAMTQAGMILGTAAYMSPEQARGKPIDRRADVWAFGCVLYEMLTARRAFGGDEVADTLAMILTKEPDWSLLAAATPPALRRLLRRCLDKDLRRRLQTIGEARIQLEDLLSGASEDTASSAGRTAAPLVFRTRERVAAGAAAVFALLAAGATGWALRPVPAPLETRLEITTPATDDPVSFAMSPDGRRLVFVGSAAGGPSQLWLRPLDQTAALPLAGTEGATFPFWSPDSRSVAFFSGTQLQRLDLGGALPRTVASAGAGARGGSWSENGVILFAPNSGPLMRVPATGGVAAAVTTLTPGQISHRFPHFLPGGRQFLFNTRGASGGLYLGSLDSAAITRLAAADTSALFLPPAWLLFLRQGTLVAQHVDLSRTALTGEPLSIADRVAFDPTSAGEAFSVSSMHAIAYRTDSIPLRQFTWFDRLGKAVGTVGQPDANNLLQPMLSPDGRRVAAYRTSPNTDLWLFDAARMIRLTFDPDRETAPVWSPDGSRIAFSKDPRGPLSLYQKSSSGAGQEELLLAPLNNALPMSWSPDGRFLLYTERKPEAGLDLWVLPMDGKQKPYPFLDSRFDERNAQFSPDGRWVAYQSDESGRPEIYVRPFPAASGQWQVSTMGGVTPRWRRDGRELYYIAPDARLMAVAVATTGLAPEIGAPLALFQPNILFGGTSSVGTAWQYDVAPDGRFLINVRTGDGGTAPITVIQNWTPTAN